MKNSSIGDYVAQEMNAITKTAAHRELFGLSKVAEKEKCEKCGKDDCECGDAMNAADVVIKDPLVVRPGEPKGSPMSDALKVDDNSAIDFEKENLSDVISSPEFLERFPEAADFLGQHLESRHPGAHEVLLDEGFESSAGFDVAIDSLLTASAALDSLGMEKTATLSLKIAELVVEAKKTDKDKTKEEKEKAKLKKAKEKEKADEMKARDKAAKEKAKEKAAKEKEAAKLKAEKEKKKADEQKAKDNFLKEKAKEKAAKEKAVEKAKKDKEKAKK